MARSLARNTRLFATILDDDLSTASPSNTFEIKVLDGYSFSQNTENQEVGISEAGVDPVRGTLTFNTALNPADVSFSTYVRPYLNNIDAADEVECVEKVLWASALAAAGYDLTPGATKAIEAQDDDYILFGTNDSNVNELMKLTLYFVFQNTTYKVLDFNVGTVEVDFSIDSIATINWTGFGSRILEDKAAHATIAGWQSDIELATETGADYKGVPATTSDTFLRNKLSVMTLSDNVFLDSDSALVDATMSGASGNTITMTATDSDITEANFKGGRVYNDDLSEWRTIVSVTDTQTFVVDNSSITGQDAATAGWDNGDNLVLYRPIEHAGDGNADTSGIVYSIPITGGTLSIENNFTYLTPEELAIVNIPLPGFAGNRSTSGSVTAYLNTGAEGSGGLLGDMLSKIDEVSNNFHLTLYMGNSPTSYPHVKFDIPHAQIGVPTTGVEDVISTEITFAGKPWNTSLDEASFEDTNEITIAYQNSVAD